MGEDPGTSGTAVTGAQEAEQIREQIEATREQLGDTVEALAVRTDVRAQAKREVDEAKASIAGKKADVLGKVKELSPEAAVSAASGAGRKARQNPLAVAVAGAFVLGLLAGWVTKD